MCVGDCSLKIKSNHDPDTLDEIVQLVQQQIRLSKENNQNLPMHKTYALCCLNMAEELVCLKKEVRRRLDHLESSAQSVFSELKSSSIEI